VNRVSPSIGDLGISPPTSCATVEVSPNHFFVSLSKTRQRYTFCAAIVFGKGLAHAAFNYIRLDYNIDSTIVIVYVAFRLEQNKFEPAT
jgi:hypothetical protein